MNIYDQFQLPTSNDVRKTALLNTVKTWFAHEDCCSLDEILNSLRSMEDICEGRPAPVSSKEEILNSNHFYAIAFKFENEINNTLGLNS